MARLVSGIYQALGLLSQGQLVEVDRSELVAGYLGQTATKTADVVASAAGGVLFIDEAYSLTGRARGDQYGQEAVDTLVKEMEDRRDDLVVIVAGYPAPMAGLHRREPRSGQPVPDHHRVRGLHRRRAGRDPGHLAAGRRLRADPEAVERFREVLGRTPRGSSFGNGRFARNALEAAIGHHAWRLREIEPPDHRPAASARGPRTSTRNRSTREPRRPCLRPTRDRHRRTQDAGDRTPDAGGTS